MAFVAPKSIIFSTVAVKRQAIASSYCPPSVVSVAEDDAMEGGPRKRRRLTHLTPDERMMRRKLKNRVAAQTARDRKKIRMDELEEALSVMQAENKRLQNENMSLKEKSGILSQENNCLRHKLGIDDVVRMESSAQQPGSPGSAASNRPLQQERIQALCKAATRTLTLLLTLSLTSSSASWNSSVTASRQHKMLRMTPALRQKLVNLLKLSSSNKRQKSRHVKWWGPQQRSWNPSKN